MAMTGVDLNLWVDRLAAGAEVARREARSLGADDGPLRRAVFLLNDGVWNGVAGDHFRSLLVGLDRDQLYPLAEHLCRMAAALERLHDEVSLAVQAERMGLAPPQVDIVTSLAPWRSCLYVSRVLPVGWEHPPRGSQISMDLEGVRGAARGLGGRQGSAVG